jgi:replication-associated recombination protein RarA
MLIPKPLENAFLRLKKIEEEIEDLKYIIEEEKITWQEKRKMAFVLEEYRKLREEKKQLQDLTQECMAILNGQK